AYPACAFACRVVADSKEEALDHPTKLTAGAIGTVACVLCFAWFCTLLLGFSAALEWLIAEFDGQARDDAPRVSLLLGFVAALSCLGWALQLWVCRSTRDELTELLSPLGQWDSEEEPMVPPQVIGKLQDDALEEPEEAHEALRERTSHLPIEDGAPA
ncbi:kctd6, partial [Symbiodinium microadriaticum]